MTFKTQFLILSFTIILLYSVLASAFQFLLNLNHHQGKLQVDDDLVKLKDSGWWESGWDLIFALPLWILRVPPKRW